MGVSIGTATEAVYPHFTALYTHMNLAWELLKEIPINDRIAALDSDIDRKIDVESFSKKLRSMDITNLELVTWAFHIATREKGREKYLRYWPCLKIVYSDRDLLRFSKDILEPFFQPMLDIAGAYRIF